MLSDRSIFEQNIQRPGVVSRVNKSCEKKRINLQRNISTVHRDFYAHAARKIDGRCGLISSQQMQTTVACNEERQWNSLGVDSLVKHNNTLVIIYVFA